MLLAGAVMHNCIVSELSQAGARVDGAQIALPNLFVLQICGIPAEQICEVIGRAGCIVDVRFVTHGAVFNV